MGVACLLCMAKPAPPSTSNESKEHLFEVLKRFDTAVLVTSGRDGDFHGRPMSVAGKDVDGTLWFMTSVESPKIDEIMRDARSLAVMQSSNQFVVIRGVAAVWRDRAKVDELWSEAQRIWFEGPDDPDIVLVRFSPVEAEFWDNAGARGVGFAVRALKAIATGEPMTDRGSPKAHGKVPL